jgi:serine/threonine-protein kinase
MGKPTDSHDAAGAPPESSDAYDHFRIVDEIARGGMGVVLKGHDVDLGRDVAIKILLEELGDNPPVVQRFIEEAQISGQLQHPGIVPVYEIGRTADGRPFFAMKLVKGGTFAEELGLRPDLGFELGRMISIFESVAQAMAYAHSHHVIHRDLKPSNVMVGPFGEVLLVDWGLAKVLTQTPAPEPRPASDAPDASVIATVRNDPDSNFDRSTTGSILGTLAYMSPEQARGEVEELDERTDVFSLGAMLCEILTGRPPYPRSKERGLPLAVLGDLTAAHSALDRCGADEELIALTKSCLEPVRADRPANAGVVAERVGAWLSSSEERVQAARVEAAEARAREAGQRRARWLTFGLAASVLFAVLLVAGFRLRTQQERAERLRRTEEGVAEHLGEAAFARGRGEWNEARVALAQARASFESGLGDDELAARIEAEELAIARDFDADQARLERLLQRERFGQEVELIRTRVTRTSRSKLAAYARLMQEFGVDMSSPPDEIADAIRASDLAIAMAAVLVDWARLQRLVDPTQKDEVVRLLELALAVDDDPARSALRRAILAEDRYEILRIARGEPETGLHPMTVIVLADELWQLGEYDEAMRILEQAELHNPDDFHVHAKLAARHMNVGDTDSAFVQLKAALARQPDNAWIGASLGLMHLRRGEVERAVETCRQAVWADPEDAYARHYLGVALAEQGDIDAALQSYRKAIELEPEYSFAIRRLAYALSDLGEHAEALELFLHAAELDPYNPSALNSVAWRLATLEDTSLRDPERALEFAERVMALEPNDPDYCSTYGTCLYLTGRYEESIEANERALELSEGFDRDPIEIFYLAMAHAQLGDEDRAREWLERGERLVSESASPPAEMVRFRDEARALLGSQ